MSEFHGAAHSSGSKYAERPQYPSPSGDKAPAEAQGNGKAGWYVGVLWLYVLLLAVGTVAELMDIRWILDLPIY